MNRNEKIIFENSKGEKLEFSNWTNTFQLDGLEGISGLDNIIYTSKCMAQDGSSYNGSTLNNRNIILQGTILENKNINRARLIKIFNPKLPGKLIFLDDTTNTLKYVDCIVEKAPAITSNERRPKFVISLICPIPYFKDYIENKVNIALWKPSLSFPLSPISTKPIVMGYREPNLIVNVYNSGHVTTGMTIVFLATGTLTNPSLFNINTREFFKINKTMVAGEKIIVTTEFGDKKIIDILNNIETNILNLIDLDSTFLQLECGDNLFRYDADSNLENLNVTIKYKNNYLGV